MGIICGIIDDDALAISILKSYMEKIPGIQLAFTLNSAVDAEASLLKHKPDLLFLDVEMPQLSGIEWLYTLNERPAVVISSAKKDYAAEAFDLEILDYLVKPVTFQRFTKCIHKFEQAKHPVSLKESQTDPWIFVNENKKMVKIEVSDIMYIESLKDYIKIHTRTRSVITKDQITAIAERLPASKFLRIHRSYLVSIQHIDSYNASAVEINHQEIPIGRNYKNECLEALQKSGQ
jgi:DNA-binding LytR/AlgR family response regulator